MKKVEVRREAAKRELQTAEKPDSQGLCFVGEINLSEFLKERIPAKPGAVITAGGEVVGEHEGAAYYTVGQRRGVGISTAVPMYVTETDVATNTVTVGLDRELYRRSVLTEPAHWLAGPPPRRRRFLISIRYRMEPQPATVEQRPDGLRITFEEPERGPTPGQFAALYAGDELVGSAVIK
jgi:tRNA-specific 2-thiouridylase